MCRSLKVQIQSRLSQLNEPSAFRWKARRLKKSKSDVQDIVHGEPAGMYRVSNELFGGQMKLLSAIVLEKRDSKSGTQTGSISLSQWCELTALLGQ